MYGVKHLPPVELGAAGPSIWASFAPRPAAVLPTLLSLTACALHVPLPPLSPLSFSLLTSPSSAAPLTPSAFL